MKDDIVRLSLGDTTIIDVDAYGFHRARSSKA